MANNLNYFFLPLTDGKTPLFIWTSAIMMHIFPNLDPLLSGRLVSVICGYVSLLGIYFGSLALFNNKTISRLASVFYLFSPFAFFYDRFALVDGMLMMFGIWSLVFAVLAVKKEKLIYGLLLGLTIGFGLLTKTQAIFFFLLLPLAWIFLSRKLKKVYLISLILSSGIGFLIYNSLRIFSEFYIISLKTTEFVVPLTSLIGNPLGRLPENFLSLASWEIAYLTLPICLLVIFSLFKKSKERLYLLSVFVIYFFTVAVINKVIYARFLLMFTPLLLILASVGINDVLTYIKNKYLKAIVLILFLTLPAFSIFRLITSPETAPIADNDSNQYINSWSAGNGINETVEFFEKQSKNPKKIKVGVEGTFGLLPFALEMYSHKYPNLEIVAIWPPPSEIPKGLDYYIIYQRKTPPNMPLELISEYQQGISNDYFKLYRVK